MALNRVLIDQVQYHTYSEAEVLAAFERFNDKAKTDEEFDKDWRLIQDYLEDVERYMRLLRSDIRAFNSKHKDFLFVGDANKPAKQLAGNAPG